MFIKFITFVVVVLFLLYPIIGGEIHPKNRVPNLAVGKGVCWLACADMVGREYNIKGAIGLRDKAINIDKVGIDNGCDGGHMIYYKTKYKFNITFLSNSNYKQLYQWIQDGETPIVNMKQGDEGHSVILIKAQNEDGIDKFYIVDPNFPNEIQVHGPSWFATYWYGTAQLISP